MEEIEKENEAPKLVQETSVNNTQLIAGAVIFAGILIAGAVLYTGGLGGASNGAKDPTAEIVKVKAISVDDHIRGNINAELKIVEYSDTECPFCKSYHVTLKKIMEEYGADGKVAWVYRQFPLTGIHPRAFKEAEATECANELGGNDAFWKYVDRIFEITPSNNGLDPVELQNTAKYVGLDLAVFNKCLDSEKYKTKVNASIDEATKAGARGTPFSVLITKDGSQYEIKGGAVPYERLKSIIDSALAIE